MSNKNVSPLESFEDPRKTQDNLILTLEGTRVINPSDPCVKKAKVRRILDGKRKTGELVPVNTDSLKD